MLGMALNAPGQPLVLADLPIPEVVGRVTATGRGVTRFQLGDRVGIPWLGGTCGHCAYCVDHKENLCDTPVFTGYDRNGGFA